MLQGVDVHSPPERPTEAFAFGSVNDFLHGEILSRGILHVKKGGSNPHLIGYS